MNMRIAAAFCLLTASCAGASSTSPRSSQSPEEIAMESAAKACEAKQQALAQASEAETAPPMADASGAWSCSFEEAGTATWRVAQEGGTVTIMTSSGGQTGSMTGKISARTLRIPAFGVELSIDRATMSGKWITTTPDMQACGERQVVCTR